MLRRRSGATLTSFDRTDGRSVVSAAKRPAPGSFLKGSVRFLLSYRTASGTREALEDTQSASHSVSGLQPP